MANLTWDWSSFHLARLTNVVEKRVAETDPFKIHLLDRAITSLYLDCAAAGMLFPAHQTLEAHFKSNLEGVPW